MEAPAGSPFYRVLGPFEVLDATGAPVALPGALQRRLVAALLLRHGRVVPVDVLADRLWGEAGLPDDVAGAVQTHVSRTRRLLAPAAGDAAGSDPGATGSRARTAPLARDGAPALVTGEGGYRLDVAPGAVDSHRFDRLVASAIDVRATDPAGAVACLDEALSLWRGPAWAEFADWDEARTEAARLDELRALAGEERAEALLDLGRHDEALVDLRVLTAEHPLRERARSLLLAALYRAGRQPEALREYEAYRALLADELGLDPSPALRDLERALLDHSLPPGPSRAATPAMPTAGASTRDSGPSGVTAPARQPGNATDRGRTGDLGTHGGSADRRAVGEQDVWRDGRWDEPPIDLPRPANRLIGRDRELAELHGLVAEHRAVTLAGPGGMGKTRLALELAWTVARSGRRVVLCELAPLVRGADVAPAVATALGIEPAGAPDDGPAEAQLARALRGQDLLLVLDNCEHVVDAAAALAERLVAGTASVSVLATSRERLAIDGERVHVLGPLADGDAVDLFVERARAVREGFTPSDADHGDVLYICHRLDGLPLALELAAARTQALPVRAIADALSQRFRLLTGGRRTEQRHRSLLEAVRWSFDLLDDDERDLCERLAVFVGGFTVEAAAAVAGLDPVATAELVARLVERSLVTAEAGGPAATGGGKSEPRFGMLETVRQYGLDRLAERERLDAARRAHATHFVAWAQRQRQALGDPALAGSVLGEVDGDLANLRAAHLWLAEAADCATGADLHVALYWFALLAFRPEVCTWVEADVVTTSSEHPRRADLLATASLGRWYRGDVAGARAAAEEGLARAERGTWARRALLSHRANMIGRTGDVERTVALFDEALTLAGTPPDALLTAIDRFQRLLYGALAGEAVAAEAERWVEAAETEGNPLVACWARYGAGEVLADSDPDRAREHIDAALRLAFDNGCWFVAGVAGVTSASLEARHGDPGRAAASYRHLLDLRRRGALRPIESTMLRGVAELLAATGHADTAALLHGAVTTSIAAPVFGPDAARQAALAGRLRGELGDERFAAAAERGAQLGDDEALDVAAAVLAELA